LVGIKNNFSIFFGQSRLDETGEAPNKEDKKKQRGSDWDGFSIHEVKSTRFSIAGQ
jgi:hypothetical protein